MSIKYHRFLSLAGPIFIFLTEIVMRLALTNEQVSHFYSEEGPIETLQAILAVISLPIAVYIFLKLEDFWLKVWIGIAMLGCFYIAGEELSWGQWIFHWQTPAEWATINDQDETNLHNTSTWLDQKPRALLEIGILVGGLIIPALRKWKPLKLPEKYKDIYPSNLVVFTAFSALSVKIINAIGDVTKHHLFWRGSEVMEFIIYYFVLLYLIDFKARILSKKI